MDDTRYSTRMEHIALTKPVCKACGVEVAPGTLFAHELTHPKVVATKTAKPRTCYAPKCKEVYGPHGHVPGLEGPHAY